MQEGDEGEDDFERAMEEEDDVREPPAGGAWLEDDPEALRRRRASSGRFMHDMLSAFHDLIGEGARAGNGGNEGRGVRELLRQLRSQMENAPEGDDGQFELRFGRSDERIDLRPLGIRGGRGGEEDDLPPPDVEDEDGLFGNRRRGRQFIRRVPTYVTGGLLADEGPQILLGEGRGYAELRLDEAEGSRRVAVPLEGLSVFSAGLGLDPEAEAELRGTLGRTHRLLARPAPASAAAGDRPYDYYANIGAAPSTERTHEQMHDMLVDVLQGGVAGAAGSAAAARQREAARTVPPRLNDRLGNGILRTDPAAARGQAPAYTGLLGRQDVFTQPYGGARNGAANGAVAPNGGTEITLGNLDRALELRVMELGGLRLPEQQQQPAAAAGAGAGAGAGEALAGRARDVIMDAIRGALGGLLPPGEGGAGPGAEAGAGPAAPPNANAEAAAGAAGGAEQPRPAAPADVAPPAAAAAVAAAPPQPERPAEAPAAQVAPVEAQAAPVAPVAAPRPAEEPEDEDAGMGDEMDVDVRPQTPSPSRTCSLVLSLVAMSPSLSNVDSFSSSNRTT